MSDIAGYGDTAARRELQTRPQRTGKLRRARSELSVGRDDTGAGRGGWKRWMTEAGPREPEGEVHAVDYWSFRDASKASPQNAAHIAFSQPKRIG